jgi:hypothetical protein
VQTALRQLVDDRLDGKLDGLVTGLRVAGWGWRRIADEIGQRTSLTVSYMTLRDWYPDDRKSAVVEVAS